MKKFLAVVCAAVMTVGMATTVFAQKSVSVNGVVESVSKSVDKDGKAVEVTLQKVSDQYKDAVAEIQKADTLKNLLGGKFEEGMKVVDVTEVTVPSGTQFPVTITFKIAGVKPDSKVSVLHYTGTAWEVLEGTAGDGTITATFNSLSPVAFVVDKDTNVTPSPKTGESNIMLWTGVVAIVALGGMAVTYSKKRKEA